MTPQWNRGVISPARLEADHLWRLINGQVDAVRVPNYLSPEHASRLADRVLNHERYGAYTNAPDIGRVGMAYYETVGNSDGEHAYFSQALSGIRDLRSACKGTTWPMDQVRLELDEVWPRGAQLLRTRDGRPMFQGLCRVLHSGSEILPHCDHLEWDAPFGRFNKTPIRQLALNVHLCSSEQGGELVTYDYRPDRSQYEQQRMEGSYAVRKEGLPEPAMQLKTRAGDLVIFDAHRIHAVTRTASVRVTASCFAVLFEFDGPLYLFS